MLANAVNKPLGSVPLEGDGGMKLLQHTHRLPKDAGGKMETMWGFEALGKNTS